MMIFQHRLDAIAGIGRILEEWVAENHPVIEEAYIHNNWFTPENTKASLRSWADQLRPEKLKQWVESYQIQDKTEARKVAIIMAGNIPLVGLHDLISVMVSGHMAIVKPSSDDQKLMKELITEVKKRFPETAEWIVVSDDRLPKDYDAVIATGSNNSNRYFDYYFKSKPHLLRKNRSSVAVLTGNETPEDLKKLGDDIFRYFGLGCRNVSKLYVPEGYNFNLFFESIEPYAFVVDHNKYANNYTYHKAMFLMNLESHLDNGFLLVKADASVSSPLSVLFYEVYDSSDALKKSLSENSSQIQCIIGKEAGYIPFGKAQSPELWDYADGVDTLSFLLAL